MSMLPSTITAGKQPLFLDLSDSRRKYIKRLTELTDGVVLVKSYFHIKRHTSAFLKMIKNFVNNGVTVISATEEKITITNEEDGMLLSKTLKVAVYERFTSKYEEETRNIQLEKLRIFVACKASKWSVSDIYIDELNSKQRTELYRLIADREKYDVVLIDTFGKLADTINGFADLISKIDKPIYSLKEGEVIFIEPGE